MFRILYLSTPISIMSNTLQAEYHTKDLLSIQIDKYKRVRGRVNAAEAEAAQTHRLIDRQTDIRRLAVQWYNFEAYLGLGKPFESIFGDLGKQNKTFEKIGRDCE